MNTALYTDPEEMRATASAVFRLSEEFDKLRAELQTAIADELNTACKGEVADEFTKFYNDQINPRLVEEKERIDLVANTLRSNAENFDSTSETVIATFK